jgi:hypothetical protein
MSKEWVIFVSRMEDLADDRESVLTIRDLSPGPRKYNAKVVRARVSSMPENIPDGEVLWVRSWIGHLHPEPWAIRIIEEVGDYIPGIPHGETLSVIGDSS